MDSEKLSELVVVASASAIFPTAVSSSAATVATATAAFTASATSTIAAAGRTVFLGTSFIDLERTASEGSPIELLDGGLRVFIRGHCDKCKSARFAREFILHQENFLHGTCLREIILKFILRRIERKIAYVEFVTHI